MRTSYFPGDDDVRFVHRPTRLVGFLNS